MDGRSMDVEESRVAELLDQCSDECLMRLVTNAHPVGLSITPSRDFPNPLLYSNDAAESQQLDSDLLARFQRLKAPPPTPLAPLASSSSSSTAAVAATTTTATSSSSTTTTTTTTTITSTTITEDDASQMPAPSPQDVDLLGSDLASRLAALKAPKNPKDVINPLNQHSEDPSNGATCFASDDFQGSTPKNNETEVDKLLASFTEQVRLKKEVGEGKHSSSVAGEDVESYDDNDEDNISESEVELMVEWAKDAARLGENEEDGDEDETNFPSDEDSAAADSSNDGARKKKGVVAK